MKDFSTLRTTATKLIASILLGVVLTLLATASAPAGLVLELNPADKSLAITGSDTGTPFNTFVNTGETSWEIQGLTVEDEEPFDTSGAMFSTSQGSPINFALFSSSGDDGRLSVSFFMSTGLNETLSGRGFCLSYADLSTTTQTALESLVGQELPWTAEVISVQWLLRPFPNQVVAPQ